MRVPRLASSHQRSSGTKNTSTAAMTEAAIMV